MTLSHTILIVHSDIRSTVRGLFYRLRNHLFTTIFALFLLIPFMAGITFLMVFIFIGDTALSEYVTPGDFFFTIFIIMNGRSLSTTLKQLYKNPTTELLRIVPLPPASMYRGKLTSILILNILTFSLFFLAFLFFFLRIYHDSNAAENLHISSDSITAATFFYYMFYIYLIAIFGSLCGFTIPLIYYLPSKLRNRIILFLTPILAGGAIIINYSELGSEFSTSNSNFFYPLLLTFLTTLLFFILRGMNWYFNEAINHYAPYSNTESYHNPWLVKVINLFTIGEGKKPIHHYHSRVLASKELLSSMRDSYFHIYAGMTIILTIMGVIMILSVPQEFLDAGWGWLIFPVLVSFLLFIDGSFMVTLGSISLIGKEGKRLWILRSLPVSGYNVLTGKAVSVIIPSIFGGYIMMIPLLYIAEFPAGQNLIFIVLTLCVILAFSGVGIMAGVKYPNFSEGARGSPDIVFQMFVLFLCLIFLGFIIIPPMTFYYNYGWLPGLLISFVVLMFSYSVFISGVRIGEKTFDRLSSEEYEA